MLNFIGCTIAIFISLIYFILKMGDYLECSWFHVLFPIAIYGTIYLVFKGIDYIFDEWE